MGEEVDDGVHPRVTPLRVVCEEDGIEAIGTAPRGVEMEDAAETGVEVEDAESAELETPSTECCGAVSDQRGLVLLMFPLNQLTR